MILSYCVFRLHKCSSGNEESCNSKQSKTSYAQGTSYLLILVQYYGHCVCTGCVEKGQSAVLF